MLKGIPASFTPELLRLLMEMGHGEELLLADANYPSLTTVTEGVRMYIPVYSVDDLLRDILKFYPLDYAVQYPATIMELGKENGVYDRYVNTLRDAGCAAGVETMERMAFYKRVRGVAGVVITADTTKAANIIIKKGVVHL